jgi:hypothetical protein
MKIRRLCLVSFVMVALSMLTGWRGHHHHRKHRATTPTAEMSAPKSLDLSVPLRIEDKFDTPVTQMKIEKPKKIQRELELDTQSIMSVEPEAGKTKSFDGAGITINLKR